MTIRSSMRTTRGCWSFVGFCIVLGVSSCGKITEPTRDGNSRPSHLVYAGEGPCYVFDCRPLTAQEIWELEEVLMRSTVESPYCLQLRNRFLGMLQSGQVFVGQTDTYGGVPYDGAYTSTHNQAFISHNLVGGASPGQLHQTAIHETVHDVDPQASEDVADQLGYLCYNPAG